MFTLRRSSQRGHADHGWLRSFHSFSFADYRDPAHMQFRSLRVINEDWIAPGQGFGMHPHKNMEIVTYVVAGALEHKDSLGSGEVLRPGEIQHMSAGKGIRHSEMNPSATETVHLLQIWILPERTGLNPSYEQKPISDAVNGALTLIGSRNGREGSVTIQQDVELYAAKLPVGKTVEHPLRSGRHGWVQLISGAIGVNGIGLQPGDAVSASDESVLRINVEQEAELLLFDLA